MTITDKNRNATVRTYRRKTATGKGVLIDEGGKKIEKQFTNSD